MRSILFSLLLIALIFCHAVNAEIDTRSIKEHPRNVKRADASSDSTKDSVERVKRWQTCDGEGFWEKLGYGLLSLLVTLRC